MSKAKRHLVRKAEKKASPEFPEGRAAEYYEPHESDPDALTRACPVCPAMVGQWCGGIGDVHDERHTKAELTRIVAERDRAHRAQTLLEQRLNS